MPYETKCDKVNWGDLKTEVVTKLEYLRLAWATTERDGPPELHTKMVDDIYVPAIRCLAEFCACLEVSEDEDEGEEPK